MSKTYFPFDAGAGANVTEAQWTKMAQFWLGTGVLLGEMNLFAVFADSTGMQVKVPSGRAWIRGHFFESDAQETLPITAANPANPRIDRVVIRLDWTANTIDLAVLAGTPAVAPVAPTLTQSTSLWEISLAQVLVDAAASTIAVGKVTDERTYASALITGFLPLAGGTMTNFITLHADPTSALHAVTKQYADALRAGLLVKDPVRVATTTTLPANTYAAGVLTASANGALGAQDGIALAVNDRVLVKNEATGANNGVYTVTSLGSGAAPWRLTRATDADVSAEVKAGLYVMVTEGTTNGDSAFVLTTNDPLTLGTTVLTFTQYSSLTQLTVGSGLIKSGNQISPDFSTSGGNNGTGTKVARSDHGHTIRLPHTWAIPGDIKVASVDTDYIVPFFISLPAGQTAKLAAVKHRTNTASTTVTISIQKNGVDATGFAGLSVTNTATLTDPADVTLADGDMIALVVTGITGTPKNMSVTVFIDYTHL